jgi:hypothetical protein
MRPLTTAELLLHALSQRLRRIAQVWCGVLVMLAFAHSGVQASDALDMHAVHMLWCKHHARVCCFHVGYKQSWLA